MAGWREEDLAIAPDFIVENDGKGINVNVETWFDIEEKFGVDIPEGSGAWLNLYATYRPGGSTLTMEYSINCPDDWESRAYKPTDVEKALIIKMIHEACRDYYGCSPQKFIDDVLALEMDGQPPSEFLGLLSKNEEFYSQISNAAVGWS